MYSDFLKLNWSDFSKGIIVAILTAVLTYIANALQVSGLNLDWQQVLSVAIIAGIGYLSKQFLSDSEGKVLGKIG